MTCERREERRRELTLGGGDRAWLDVEREGGSVDLDGGGEAKCDVQTIAAGALG